MGDEKRYQVVSQVDGRKHTTAPMGKAAADREAASLARNPTVESVRIVERTIHWYV